MEARLHVEGLGPDIAEYLSALANSAALHSKETAYLVWGIEDGTRNVVGTKFKPRKAKQGNEELLKLADAGRFTRK